MDINIEKKALLLVFVVGLVLFSLVGVRIYDNSVNEQMNENIINEQVEIMKDSDLSDYSHCKNLSLKDTSVCLREFLSEFYNYTIRGDKNRTIEDLIENGGDCYDYNKMYERLARELGFDSNSFRISVGNRFHRIAVISDQTGYCVMDMLFDYKCFEADDE